MKKMMLAAAMLAAAAAAQAQTGGTPAPAPAPAPTDEAKAPAADGKFTLDTPLQDIVADEKGKAVIEKHFPGMIALPEYEMFKAISLNQLQPYANGKITDEMLAATAADLAEIK
ncbi:hypothetical protein [Sphingopyxis sp. PET50]|uniref:hypothetical protein n=1 Tax=Sphingopyxis sp. PET50 TaxID=2976533 RepID=UPI0021B02591|nr:hypothetical protein [Sphingopyxis sp. PET50]